MADRATEEANATLPNSFYFVDISFLAEVDPKEYPDLKTEERFFEAHNASFGTPFITSVYKSVKRRTPFPLLVLFL